MTCVGIDLPPGLPADVGEEMAKRACYCDTRIVGCRFDPKDHRLHLRVNNGTRPEELVGKVERLVNQMSSERLSVTPAVVKQRQGSHNGYDPNPVADLIESGELTEEGVGVVGRSGRMLSLLERFDKLVTRIAVEAFGAELRDYNVLMPSDYLRRAGYFTSFAHSLTFAFHLREDLDCLETFATRHREGEDLKLEALDEITTPEYCLSPAVCYHTYGAMIDHSLDKSDNGLKVQTAGGRCFRYESKNITALDRLWEFSMREIIFVGEKERVLAARRRSMEIIWRLVERLDLTASLETASDPFFATDFRSLRFFQLANELKYELRLPINDTKSVASASFNYHEAFFGDNFGIGTASGKNAHTGCAAFGLERLVLASMAQLGYDLTCDRLGAIEANLSELLEGDPL